MYRYSYGYPTQQRIRKGGTMKVIAYGVTCLIMLGVGVFIGQYGLMNDPLRQAQAEQIRANTAYQAQVQSELAPADAALQAATMQIALNEKRWFSAVKLTVVTAVGLGVSLGFALAATKVLLVVADPLKAALAARLTRQVQRPLVAPAAGAGPNGQMARTRPEGQPIRYPVMNGANETHSPMMGNGNGFGHEEIRH